MKLYFKTIGEYGKRIVPTLSVQLKERYRKNFELRNLRCMKQQFAEQFSDKQIVGALSRELRWSLFLAILPVKNTEAKFFCEDQVNSHLMY
jgi:hypothetical protein